MVSGFRLFQYHNNSTRTTLPLNLFQSYIPLTMDKLSGLTSKLGGGSSHKSHTTDNRDYVDKGMALLSQDKPVYSQLTLPGLDSLETKYGGGKIDPNNAKTRQTNEKITDAAREKFESLTGYVSYSSTMKTMLILAGCRKNVPSKISN